ncbi:MAG TPA: hypothetical protein VMM13_02870 [Euzebya sp.]|nr:hypothetical protein [Euzebya sp.]
MLPDAIHEMARRSCGVLDRGEMLRRGYGDEAIFQWRLRGLIETLLPGRYRIVGAPVPPIQCLEVVARYLADKRSAVPPLLTGRGALGALDGPGFELPTRASALIQRGTRVRIAGNPFDAIQTRLELVDSLRVRGLHLATPPRLLVDLAEHLTDAELIDAVDAVRNHLRLTQVELITAWRRIRHPQARRLLRLADAGAFDTESGGERRVLQLLFAEYPPMPDCQVQITSAYRADFAFIFAALILEYYGEEAHRGRVDADGVRVATMRRPGWDVFVITKSLTRDLRGLSEQIHELRREREAAMLEGRLRRPPLPRQPPRRMPLRTLAPSG